MHSGYKIFLYVTIIEFALIFSIVIFTYTVKCVLHYYKKYYDNSLEQLEKYIKRTIMHPQKSVIQINTKYKKLKMLLAVIEKFEARHDAAWHHYQSALSKTVLLPLARQYVTHRAWVNRLLAAKSFRYAVELSDETAVCRLLSDKVPIVRLVAVDIANHIPTKKVINTIITRVAEVRKKSHFFYLSAFSAKSADISDVVIERLKSEKEPFARAACYTLLLNLDDDEINYASLSKQTIHDDIHSEYLELSLAAIRFIARSEKKQSIPLLVKTLSNPQWQKRVVAIQALKKLLAIEAIQSLQLCLSDPERWVRFNAAEALLAMGSPGIKILNEIDKDQQPLAFDAAMHVLKKV